MATDSSPPKIRVILTVAFSSVVILGALNLVFNSYFEMMKDEADRAHLRTNEVLVTLREGEQKNLHSGPLPIDKAIALLAEHGRGGDAPEALKDVAPVQSTDMGPMVGWIRTPNQAVIDRLTAEANAAADAGAPAAAGEGGVPAAAGEGGAAPASAATDAAPAPSPDAGPAPKNPPGTP